VELRSRRAATQSGYNDGLTQALTFVVAPLLLGLLGFAFDRWLGTRPILMLLLGCLGVVGTFVTAFYEYQARCAREDEGKPWTRRRA
jgi:F0F1-type ATP synthase assembly protein I